MILTLRAKSSLAAENLFLRKQLSFYQERKIKPRRTSHPTRLTLVWLSLWFNLRSALIVVTPKTFIGRHSKGFQLFWPRKCQLITIESLGLRHYGPIGGTLNAFNVAGSASGPLVIGALFDLTGSYATAFKLCLTVFVFAAFLTLGCKREVQDTKASSTIVAATSQA